MTMYVNSILRKLKIFIWVLTNLCFQQIMRTMMAGIEEISGVRGDNYVRVSVKVLLFIFKHTS